MKQDSNLSELIRPVPEIVAIASRSMELRSGGPVSTGTPAGVGPVQHGEVMAGGIDGLGEAGIAVR